MKPAYLIPVYNHGSTAFSVVDRLLKQRDLPVIMVDDGSDKETEEQLAEIARTWPQVILIRRETNGGKGAAIRAGISRAHELGISHILQVDADGQHDLEQAAFFLGKSALCPEALISGTPVFDESAPSSRRNGRRISNAWASITTLSPVADALCGFRVYPVEPLLHLFERCSIDKRMGFEPDVLVRLYWQGLPLIFHPVGVKYPVGGISHFHLVRDNIHISWVFFRLFFGMILRFPMLLCRRLRRS